ncbi:MAG: Hsp20/alpha crystallin family protein [Candidatus Cryptobacteroides sp.]|nr:Hsp20/alpha crystallin family protein [Candidatus Cryptobacteroides sp.]
MTPMRRYEQNWLPEIFNDFFANDWMNRTSTTAPAINVIEDETDYKVEVAAPGMTKEDFKVNVTDDNYLVLTLEKKNESKDEDKTRKYLRREFSYHKFEQSLALPEDVNRDEIKATVNNGILTIEIPKVKVTEKQPAVKQIEIQ